MSIGYLAKSTSTRPSDLFEWKDEKEMIERLMFDILCMSKVVELEEREYKKLKI